MRSICVGVDPGIANTVLAIVVRPPSDYKLVALRCVTSRVDEPEAQRLRKIYDAVDALLAEHTINGAAIEVTPQQVKQATGMGSKAHKDCVTRAMARLLRVNPKIFNEHTADAAAAAMAGLLIDLTRTR